MIVSSQTYNNVIELDNHQPKQRQWRKVLYDKQLYPDNYVDEKKFLESLDFSKPVDDSNYVDLVIGTFTILQQISVVAIFVALYKYILYKVITVYGIVAIDLIALFVNYFINKIFNDDYKIFSSDYSLSQTSLPLLIIGVYVRICAPVLQTLTSSFSDDTIHALAIVFSTVHLLSYHYSYVNCETDVFEGTLSLSAAMLTAILLASRLTDIDVVFGFVVLAIICFSLFPIIARLLKRKSIIIHVIIVILLYLTASNLLLHLEVTLFGVYQVLVVLLFLCPILFKRMMKIKRSYRGPWDIASPQRNATNN